MTQIRPFAPGLFSTDRQANDLAGLRKGLSELNRQLATGRRSETLGGLGPDRTSVLNIRAEVASLKGYQASAERGSLRLNLMTDTLTRLQTLATEQRTDTTSPMYAANAAGMNTAVRGARGRLDGALSELNSDFDGQFLFAGRAVTTRPMLDSTAMIDGQPGKDGLRTLIGERRLADAGDGLGRLSLSAAGPSVTLAQTAPGLPFGYGLGAVRNGMAGSTVTGPSGSPASLSIAFTGPPSEGQTLELDLTLPDGSTETLRLTARTPPLPANSTGMVAIDSDPAVMAQNVRAALDSAIRQKAGTALAAASAMVAADDFFSATTATPARRIAGPPFDTATGFVVVGSRPTVSWYQGEASADPRAAQTAAIDRGVVFGVGASGGEEAIRKAVAGFAVIAAEQFSASDPAAGGRYTALAERVNGSITNEGGQRLRDIASELALASAAMGDAMTRQLQKAGVLETALSGIETPGIEELSASILSLQTRLQASYQATASIGRLSLASYL